MEEGSGILIASLVAVVLFVLGLPIFLVIGLWVLLVSYFIEFTFANIGVSLFEGLNFFGLLALPLFILTGDLINSTGIAKRLTDFAYSALGWLRGGLAMSTLAACGIFSAISGSNTATTATIGSITYKDLLQKGYDKHFAAATIASGGTVGIIIPPSIIFIVYGFLMQISISDLFIGGFLPGLLMVTFMMIACHFVSKKNKWGELIPFKPGTVLKKGMQAWLGFLAIFIVMVGIYGGIFSPTEAAGVTVGFCFLVGIFVTRNLSLKALPKIMLRSGQITGLLAPLIAISVVMQQILSLVGIRDFVAEFVSSLGGYYPVLAFCMLLVFITGTFLESLPDVIILAPILAPVAASVGIDPVHFAVIFLVGDAIGFITPPYGLNLYVASGITGIPYFRLVKHTLPYLAILMLAWFIIALTPALSTILIPTPS